LIRAMKILVVNSNTTRAVTDTIAAEARVAASPGTEIVAVTALFGPAAIQGRADAVIAAHATLEVITHHPGPVDAAVIACFSDPGLMAARDAAGSRGRHRRSLDADRLHAGRALFHRHRRPRHRAPDPRLASAYGLAQRLASCARLTRRPRKATPTPREPSGD